MQQSAQFIEALKRCLKAKGMTYHTLAENLGLSETSIKRNFSEGSFSLKRIGAILDVLDVNFADVVKLIATPTAKRQSLLTFDQESVLASDKKLFAFFHLLLFGISVEDARQQHSLTSLQTRRLIGILKDMNLVEVKSDGQVRSLIDRRVSWRDNGPLRKAYAKQLIGEFLKDPFDGDQEVFTFKTRSLTLASQAQLAKKMQLLIAELDDLSAIDTAVVKGKTKPVALVMGFRPFTFSLASVTER